MQRRMRRQIIRSILASAQAAPELVRRDLRAVRVITQGTLIHMNHINTSDCVLRSARVTCY